MSIKDNLCPNAFRHFLNHWPPFLGAGVKESKINKDFK